MRYIKRLCAALAAAMLITLVGCNAAVTSPVQGEEELVAVPERTHTPTPVLTPEPTPEQTAEPEPAEEPAPSPTPDDGLPYYLYVEKGSFTLTIYEKDENGEYTKVFRTYRIAHGGNKTPRGNLYPWWGKYARTLARFSGRWNGAVRHPLRRQAVYPFPALRNKRPHADVAQVL